MTYKRARVTFEGYISEQRGTDTRDAHIYLYPEVPGEDHSRQVGSLRSEHLTVKYLPEPDPAFGANFVAFRDGGPPIVRDYDGVWWLAGGVRSASTDENVLDGLRDGTYRIVNDNGEQVQP